MTILIYTASGTKIEAEIAEVVVNDREWQNDLELWRYGPSEQTEKIDLRDAVKVEILL